MSNTKKTAKTATKKATTKKVATKKAATFAPNPDKANMERGNEFLSLRKAGHSVPQIIKMYGDAGISLQTPVVYSAIKLAKAPKFVRDAVHSGAIPATEAVQLLKPLRATKGEMKGRMVEESQEEFVARVQASLDAAIAEREARREKLEKAGFTSEGQVKFTKTRTFAIVAANLSKVKGALKNPRLAAIIEFEKALNSGATVEELMATATGK